MIIYIPVMNINFPALVSDCFEKLYPITTFDPYPIQILNYLHFDIFGFQETKKLPRNENFAQLGFSSRNPIMILNGQFINIMLFVCSKIILILIIIIPKNKFTTKIRDKIELKGKNTQVISKFLI